MRVELRVRVPTADRDTRFSSSQRARRSVIARSYGRDRLRSAFFFPSFLFAVEQARRSPPIFSSMCARDAAIIREQQYCIKTRVQINCRLRIRIDGILIASLSREMAVQLARLVYNLNNQSGRFTRGRRRAGDLSACTYRAMHRSAN